MVTLRQISKLTGFSVSTVSKALNDRLDINENTRKYIMDIALKNNYVSNKTAVSLRKQRSNIIAVILPRVDNTLYGKVLFNMQKAASNFAYRIMLFQSLSDVSKEKQYIREVNDGSIDAAVIISTNNNNNSKINVPLEFLKITENQDVEDAKQKCIRNFNQLLKQIV